MGRYFVLHDLDRSVEDFVRSLFDGIQISDIASDRDVQGGFEGIGIADINVFYRRDRRIQLHDEMAERVVGFASQRLGGPGF